MNTLHNAGLAVLLMALVSCQCACGPCRSRSQDTQGDLPRLMHPRLQQVYTAHAAAIQEGRQAIQANDVTRLRAALVAVNAAGDQLQQVGSLLVQEGHSDPKVREAVAPVAFALFGMRGDLENALAGLGHPEEGLRALPNADRTAPKEKL